MIVDALRAREAVNRILLRRLRYSGPGLTKDELLHDCASWEQPIYLAAIDDLCQRGLVMKQSNGFYFITDKGKSFMRRIALR